MFLSLGARIEINVEALNAVETVGNVTKHRRAPIIKPEGEGYKLIYAPAISGESLAHAFQRNLVEAARIVYGREGIKPPLTAWDERCEFVKYMDREHLTQELKDLLERKGQGSLPDVKHDFELKAIKQSIVADVGGFLYAEEELPVKRTSRIQVGYMLPTYDTLDTVAIEAQFHVRHVPSEAGEAGVRPAQMIYYVEVASAVYGLTINLDVDGIGRTSLVKVEDAVDLSERVRRVKASLMALAGLFTGEGFGAKLSRFLPIKRVRSMVATLSRPIAFTVSPPQLPNYIEDTAMRLKTFKDMLTNLGLEPQLSIVAYAEKVPEEVEPASSVEDLLLKVINKVISAVEVK